MRLAVLDTIDQAIFTSASAGAMAGYQLVATSAGVTSEEARQLETWCPAHDSLLAPPHEPASLNFFTFSSGRSCLSYTVAAGAEYSGRAGARIYTQCFVLSPQVLARFSGNPFAVWQALVAAGRFVIYESVPHRLCEWVLAGRAAVCHYEWVWRAVSELGINTLATLLDMALCAKTLAVRGARNLELVFGALVNLLPPGDRPAYSLSTGLRFSPRRPYRLLAAPENAGEQRVLETQHGVRVVDVRALTHSPVVSLQHAWAKRVCEALTQRRLQHLFRTASEISLVSK